MKLNMMNGMCGIKTSGAPSGRGNNHYGTSSQGIVLAHSALGYGLLAFQAMD
jgi:hypothetical protein